MLAGSGLARQAPQAGSPAKASTVLIDVASPQQENLVLGYVHHSIELFHRDCRVTCCYQCQGMGLMARVPP